MLEEGCDDYLLLLKKALIQNVPYRFLAPFFNFSEKEWRLSKNELIAKINEINEIPYTFGDYEGLNTMIFLSRKWLAYMVENEPELLEKAKRCFFQFVKRPYCI